jgi:hypothetical protein
MELYTIQNKIYEIRDYRGMLDFDLIELLRRDGYVRGIERPVGRYSQITY